MSVESTLIYVLLIYFVYSFYQEKVFKFAHAQF